MKFNNVEWILVHLRGQRSSDLCYVTTPYHMTYWIIHLCVCTNSFSDIYSDYNVVYGRGDPPNQNVPPKNMLQSPPPPPPPPKHTHIQTKCSSPETLLMNIVILTYQTQNQKYVVDEVTSRQSTPCRCGQGRLRDSCQCEDPTASPYHPTRNLQLAALGESRSTEHWTPIICI